MPSAGQPTRPALHEQTREVARDMTQTVSTLVGALLFGIALCELTFPTFVQMNLSVQHCLIIGSAGGLMLPYCRSGNTSRKAPAPIRPYLRE